MTLIDEMLQTYKKLHFSLIDPDKQTLEEAGRIAKICEEVGTNAIMVGGSTVRNSNLVYDTIESIKSNTRLPIILFPNSAESISENVEYILFMRLLNSIENKYQFEEPIKGSPLIKKWNIKPISTGYIVVSSSKKPTTVEKNVKLNKIHLNDIDKAVEYAVYGELTGLSCIYFDAGSGADPPISNDMIQAIKKNISIPLIIGGGIRNGDIAKEKIDAGADIIVNGTMVEQDIEVIGDIVKKIQIPILNDKAYS